MEPRTYSNFCPPPCQAVADERDSIPASLAFLESTIKRAWDTLNELHRRLAPVSVPVECDGSNLELPKNNNVRANIRMCGDIVSNLADRIESINRDLEL